VKFVVVGASGFIGRCMLDHVRNEGFDAVGTRASAADENLLRFDLNSDRIADCLPAGFFVEGVPVYAAVFACVCQLDRCRRERETSYRINVRQTIQLLDDLAQLGAKPVFISSSYVHDGRTGYYTEESPPSPINEYGQHKLEVEQYIDKHLPQALVLRLDKIVGDEPTTSHLFTEWYRWIDEGRSITCIADQILSPTLSTDVARAVVAGCEQELNGLYNVANTEFIERAELARQFAAICGREAAIVSKPMDAFNFDDARPLKSYLDSSKFIRATGMRFTTMRETMEAFVAKARGA